MERYLSIVLDVVTDDAHKHTTCVMMSVMQQLPRSSLRLLRVSFND